MNQFVTTNISLYFNYTVIFRFFLWFLKICHHGFRKKLKNVPFFACAHHELLDGKGYPRGLKGDSIPLEARILALVDIYDALTARDRPYKEALTNEEALRIIELMVKDGKLDADLFAIFKKERVWEKI